jgi:microcystin-dependent protein
MENINFPSSPTNGQQYSYGAATYVYDSTIPGWLAYPTLPGGVPAGTIVQWGTATAPANWMICDGSAISRSTYASLFNVIGTTYGAGDGSTTFNLPNLKGRVPIGLDGSQTQFTTLGQTGGNKSLALYGTGTATGYGLTYSGSMNTADDGTASNLQPYVVVNYIIKTSMANTPGDSALATRVGALETFNTQAQPVPVGGTGATSFTSGSYLKGNGTAAIQAQVGIPGSDITGYMSPNYIINGAFDIWQRGTTGTQAATTTGYPSADRFKVYSAGAAAPALTLAQSTDVPTGVGVSYSAAFSWSASTSTGDVILGQVIENGKYLFAGKIVTVSFYAKATSAISVNSVFDQDYANNPQNITTSWARYQYTVTLPSTYQSAPPSGSSTGNNTEIRLIRLTNTSSAANTIYVTGVQVEVAGVASAFRRNANSLQGELAACQRYYYRWTTGGGQYGIAGSGVADGTTSAQVSIQFPVTMRVAVSVTPESGGSFNLWGSGASVAVTSFATLTTPFMGNQNTIIYAAVASGLTTNYGYSLRSTTTNAYLGFSAEL